MTSVTWHDVECGVYAADLVLWEELAADADPILELGCGTGRVSLHLARRGHRVVGMDIDEELLTAFAERARGLNATPVRADARRFELPTRFPLVLAPMQLLQLFREPGERVSCLRSVAAHLRPGGRAALAIVDGAPEDDAGGGAPLLPDTREIDGWVFSSLPLEATVGSGDIVVRRLRQTVSPAGRLSDELDEVRLALLPPQALEGEAVEAGLFPAGRRTVPATEDHYGSTVVLLEKES
jgi:SAM-dependent methyltransferase